MTYHRFFFKFPFSLCPGSVASLSSGAPPTHGGPSPPKFTTQAWGTLLESPYWPTSPFPSLTSVASILVLVKLTSSLNYANKAMVFRIRGARRHVAPRACGRSWLESAANQSAAAHKGCDAPMQTRMDKRTSEGWRGVR